eukprot:31502-Pelagococcus_subviridis.AAC.1
MPSSATRPSAASRFARARRSRSRRRSRRRARRAPRRARCPAVARAVSTSRLEEFRHKSPVRLASPRSDLHLIPRDIPTTDVRVVRFHWQLSEHGYGREEAGGARRSVRPRRARRRG